MSPVPSIGLAEILILASCGGLALLVGVIVAALILAQRKTRDTPLDAAGASETDQGESRPATRLRYVLLAVLLLIALGILIALDIFASVSIYLRFVAVYAAFWVLVGGLLLRDSPVRHKLVILAIFVAAVASILFINWNSRKPFLKDFRRLQEGMTEAQVDGVMGRYIVETDLPPLPLGGGTVAVDAVVYRHTDESWGKSDWGVVAFEDGRVAQTELFSFGLSSRSTPPGANMAGGGLGQARYVFLQWKEGLEIMIWHDVLGGSGEGKGSGSTTDPIYRYQGYAESSDGRRFDWEVQTADGKTALFKIDDTRYDLADGRLFLVTTRGGRTEVRQLDRDLSGVQPDWESIVVFAKSDPDVAEFAGVTPDSH